MSNKMKGVLKGLRYISQIFEDGAEEQEMQIGFPTDVKHVAHIGWDGPAASAPSWIKKFKEGDPGAAPSNGEQQTGPTQVSVQERRCSTGTDPILKSRSKRQASDKGKSSRRHSSASESPNRTLASQSPSQSSGPDSPPRDTPSSAKTSRRRKQKTSSSKSKTSTTVESSGYSDTGVVSNGSKIKDSCQGLEEQNATDAKSRRIPAM